jgi:ABC-type Fe3+/spermidine/putrescine transport system ATPase subunit
MNSGHAIRIVEARKSYGSLAALDGLSLNINSGEFTVLLGPSGSGKSTLIRSLAGVEKLDSGSIFFGDQEVNRGPINLAPEKRDLAMVFQDYALWPHLTAFENVGYALKRRKLPPQEFAASVMKAITRVGLGLKGEHYPHQLSGGEQQRIALARAIVADPSLLLFDEPLSNLDADLRERLRIEISSLTREIGATALYITHDQSEAFALADRIGVINNGSIVQVDRPEIIYEKPASRFVATFTGIAGYFRGTVKSLSKDGCLVSLGTDTLKARRTVELNIGQKVDILVRPAASQFRIADDKGDKRNLVSAKIKDLAYRGRGYDHAVDTKYGSLTGVFDSISHPRGKNLVIAIDPTKCIAFPKDEEK